MSSLRVTGGADVDPYLYLDPPLLDASGVLALGQAIVDVAPLSPPPSMLSALRRLRQALDDLQTLLRHHREAPAPVLAPRPESRQPADFAVDNAWTALYERLRAYVMLPESEVPRVKRAHELLRILFPDALGFLRLPHEAEWQESDKRLRSIEKLSLTEDLCAVAGAEFLAEVRRAQDLYSRALGRKPDGIVAVDADKAHGSNRDKELRDSSETPAIRDQRLHVARCLSAYALKVLALTPDDVKDFQAVKRWLAPLAAYQRAEARKTSAAPSNGKPAPAPSTSGGPTPSSPSVTDWASSLRSSEISSGEHKPLGESGLFRAPGSTSGGGGQSGTYRPVNESGLFRPVKRPPPSSG